VRSGKLTASEGDQNLSSKMQGDVIW